MPTQLTEKYKERLKSLMGEEGAPIKNPRNGKSISDQMLRRNFSDLPLREALFWEMQRKWQTKNRSAV
jgi:hypothetical protein